MFDFGLAEFLFIAIITVLVIGPKEIPSVMRAAGKLMRRLQYVRYAFSQQFEEFMREQDLDDIRKSVNFEEARHDAMNFDEAEADEDVMEEEASANER